MCEAESVRLAALERTVAEQNKRYEEAFRGWERECDKRDTALDHRFNTMNEFRQAMADQQATYLTRNEYTTQHQALTDRLDQAQKNLDREVSTLRERANSARIQSIILTAMMTAIFSLMIYLIFLHIE